MQLIGSPSTGGKLQPAPGFVPPATWREERYSEGKLFQTDTMDSAKKQASLFSFFQKTPKSNIGPNGDKPKSESNKQTSMKKESDSSWEVEITFNIHDKCCQPNYQAGLLVWARLTGYPWWPAIVCQHPTSVSLMLSTR